MRARTTAEDEFRAAFEILVSERGAANAPRRPSEGFRAVLLALLGAPPRGLYGRELVARTPVGQANLVPLLARMRERYGLVERHDEPGSMTELGRRQRGYHRLTPAGRRLARLALLAEQARSETERSA